MHLALCQNHQTNLIVCDAVANSRNTPGTGGKLWANMFCTALFLRMGGHFTRLLVSVHTLARDNNNMVEWIASPTADQLAAGKEYSQELAAYLIDNLRHNSRQMSAEVRPGSPPNPSAVSVQHDQR